MKQVIKSEATQSIEAVSGTIGRTTKTTEELEAHGHYTAALTGPVEEFRGLYVSTRNALWAAQAVKNTIRVVELEIALTTIPMEVKWKDEIENLVVTTGKNFALDTIFAGSAYTAAWYMGLVDGSSTPTYNATDTMASHAGWTENAAYSQASRPTTTWSAAAAGAKALSAALTFSMNAAATIAGCFINTIATKSGTTGTLFSAGSFTGGNKIVANGDTLSVSYSANM